MSTVKEIETKKASAAPVKVTVQHDKEEEDDGSSDDSSIGDTHGSWIRRRRLDGALNRVPLGFYSKIWNILESCHAIVIVDDKRLETSLTQEMTSGEMKFALVVESVLNSVPEPEYRQMLVEALCVVSMIVENQVCVVFLIYFLGDFLNLHFNRKLFMILICIAINYCR
jgi:hypothetical protein